MSGSSLITLRLPTSLVQRADALLDQLAKSNDPVLLGRASRSIVLRLAVLRGLEQLQAQVETGGTASMDGRSGAARSKRRPTRRTPA